MRISLWIGCAPSWEVLDQCLSFTFSDDGDAIPCAFGEAFGIDWFDEDFREASVSDVPSSSITELLVGHSSDAAISQAVAMAGADSVAEPCNSLVLLYDFEFTGSVHTARIGNVDLEFVGCFEITL